MSIVPENQRWNPCVKLSLPCGKSACDLPVFRKHARAIPQPPFSGENATGSADYLYLLATVLKACRCCELICWLCWRVNQKRSLFINRLAGKLIMSIYFSVCRRLICVRLISRAYSSLVHFSCPASTYLLQCNSAAVICFLYHAYRNFHLFFNFALW